MKKMNKLSLILFISLVTLALPSLVLAISPSGASLTSISNETGSLDVAGSHSAIAGNVTEMGVASTVTLADGSDNVMYNWSLASPEGEIYASVNNSINWVGTQCYNNTTFTSNLELEYNIANNDVDGIDETFSLQDHDAFYVNNVLINTNTCMSTRIYGDTGAGVNAEFEEVLLKGGSNETIFASILEENMLGFDSASHDFQMIVLEDGHNADTSTRPYYFFVELE